MFNKYFLWNNFILKFDSLEWPWQQEPEKLKKKPENLKTKVEGIKIKFNDLYQRIDALNNRNGNIGFKIENSTRMSHNSNIMSFTTKKKRYNYNEIGLFITNSDNKQVYKIVINLTPMEQVVYDYYDSETDMVRSSQIMVSEDEADVNFVAFKLLGAIEAWVEQAEAWVELAEAREAEARVKEAKYFETKVEGIKIMLEALYKRIQDALGNKNRNIGFKIENLEKKVEEIKIKFKALYQRIDALNNRNSNIGFKIENSNITSFTTKESPYNVHEIGFFQTNSDNKQYTRIVINLTPSGKIIYDVYSEDSGGVDISIIMDPENEEEVGYVIKLLDSIEARVKRAEVIEENVLKE